MSTPGINSMVVIGDADGLISLMQADDVNHDLAEKALKVLISRDATIVFPLTAIVEAVTTLQRKLNNPEYAQLLLERAVKKELLVEEVDMALLGEADQVFRAYGSKQNTLFDAIVAAFAKRYRTDVIFSLDGWYAKQGFKIITAFSKFPHTSP